jgi:DNA-binding NarL/FixJ family response regulator
MTINHNKIKVIIVDDHNLFRNGLKILLNNENIEVIGEASNGNEFLEIIKTKRPDIVLMDIEMPIMNGIEASQTALEKYPELKIIALSMFDEEEYYYKMIDAGVKGFILKNSDITEVIKAIETVYKGETFFPQNILYQVIKNIKSSIENDTVETNLSRRETEILKQICLGYSNTEIAQNLFISKRTVEKHRANLLIKTGSKNTANLIIYAIKHKLVEI